MFVTTFLNFFAIKIYDILRCFSLRYLYQTIDIKQKYSKFIIAQKSVGKIPTLNFINIKLFLT